MKNVVRFPTERCRKSTLHWIENMKKNNADKKLVFETIVKINQQFFGKSSDEALKTKIIERVQNEN